MDQRVIADRRRMAGVVRLAGALAGQVWTGAQVRTAAAALHALVAAAGVHPSRGAQRAAVAALRLRGDRAGAAILEAACATLFMVDHAHG